MGKPKYDPLDNVEIHIDKAIYYLEGLTLNLDEAERLTNMFRKLNDEYTNAVRYAGEL